MSISSLLVTIFSLEMQIDTVDGHRNSGWLGLAVVQSGLQYEVST